MLTLEDDILINQWVQEIKATSVLVEWFESGTPDRRLELLRHLLNLCNQARVREEDSQMALVASKLNPRRSAGVILSKGATKSVLHKLSTLRKMDGGDAFVLLLHLLKIADERRRAAEGPGPCHHWWHRDLGDDAVVEAIRREYAAGRL
jgi:hypothetical protein